MKELTLLKVTRNTRLVRKGQKAWLISGTGACAALALTRYRGKGRWIATWLHWEWERGKAFISGTPDCKYLGKVQVSDSFYNQLKATPQGRHWLD